MPTKTWKLMSSRGLLISFLILALLLAGCGEGFSLDVNLDGGGASIDNSSLFLVLVVVLIAVLAIVVVGRR